MDCDDRLELGSFWARVRGGEVASQSEKTVIIRTDWVWLAALKVDDYTPPTRPANGVPKQIHLDLSVEDLDAAAVEAVQAGARIAVFQPAPESWRVLLDPAGHPFCLTTQAGTLV